MLLGDDKTPLGTSSLAAGVSQAFQFRARGAGTASTVHVYVGAKNAASVLVVGLYASEAGQPGTLLTTGALYAPRAGAWDTVPVASEQLTAGETYWIAVLGTGGTLRVRAKRNGGCGTAVPTSQSGSLMAAAWRTSTVARTCPIAAYVTGGSAASLQVDREPFLESAPPAPAVVPAEQPTLLPELPSTLPPIDLLPPLITGAPIEGQTLEASTGTWAGSPTAISLQWQQCDLLALSCTDVPGATESSITPSAADVGRTLRVIATAVNGAGSTSAASLPTAVIQAPITPPEAPASVLAPLITGTTLEGQTLEASTGTWTGSPTSFAYQWQQCDAVGQHCTSLHSATTATHTLSASDVGHTLRVRVTATNVSGSSGATSLATLVVLALPPAPPTSTAVPVISGSAVEGQTLKASNGSWSGSPTSFSYQWQDCALLSLICSDISGASSATYTLNAGDVGGTVRVVVSATNAGGSGSADSATTATVAAAPPGAPVSTALPTVSGSAVEGQTLEASAGSWSGAPTSFAYQWEDCNSSGASCVNVSGATGSSFVARAQDVGHTLRVTVTASNSGGSGSATSAQTAAVAAVPPAAPVNTAVPTITGSAVEGQTLKASNGSWSGSPTSFAYQWQDCDSSGASCANIASAASSTYTLGSGDVGHTVRVLVTASNSGGSASATSAHTASVTAAPPAAPANTAVPTVSGSAVEGQTLEASAGSWSGSPTSFAYQWEDCNSSGASCANIASATSSSYTLASADVGHTVRVLVTASNAGGSAAAASAHTTNVTSALPAAPANTAVPTISGSAVEGQTLKASNGSWSGSPTSFAYQWEDCNSSGASCANIASAASSTYTLGSGDVGHTVRVAVTASNAGGSAAATSAQTAAVTAVPPTAPANTAVPTVTGSAVEGQTLKASNGSWSGSPTSFAYQWQDCNSAGASCANIASAASSTYPLASGDVGHTVRVVVTAANAGGSASATSAQTAEVASDPVSSGDGAPEPACTVETESATTAKSDLAINGEVVCLKAGGSPYSSMTISSGPSSTNSTLVSAPGQRVLVKGVTLTTSHITVEGLHIENGINVGTGNSTAYNHDVIAWNDITNTSGDGVGIFARVEGPVSEFINIEHNMIHNTSLTSEGDAIHAQGWANLTIRGNDIYEISEEVCKGACHDDIFQTYNADFKTAHDFLFEDNYVHDNDTEGILLKDGDTSPNATIRDNLMIRDQRWGGIAGVWADDCTQNLVIEKNTLTEGNDIQPLSDSCTNPSAVIKHNVLGRLKLGGEASSGTYSLTSEANLFGEGAAGLYKTGSGDETKSLTGSTTYKCSPSCKVGADDYRLTTNPKGAGIDWNPSEESYGPNH